MDFRHFHAFNQQFDPIHPILWIMSKLPILIRLCLFRELFVVTEIKLNADLVMRTRDIDDARLWNLNGTWSTSSTL